MTPSHSSPMVPSVLKSGALSSPARHSSPPVMTSAHPPTRLSTIGAREAGSKDLPTSLQERDSTVIELSRVSSPGPCMKTETRNPLRLNEVKHQDDKHAFSHKPVEQTLEICNDSLGTANEAGSPTRPISQSRPPELANLAAEIVFVLVCSVGQLLFAVYLGNVEVNQLLLLKVLNIPESLTAWLIGSFLLANGLSVVLSGSLADLIPPKPLMVSAFVWLTIWNVIGVFSISHTRRILFFFVRAMQGLAVGVLVSGSISILGRIYQPGTVDYCGRESPKTLSIIRHQALGKPAYFL